MDACIDTGKIAFRELRVAVVRDLFMSKPPIKVPPYTNDTDMDAWWAAWQIEEDRINKSISDHYNSNCECGADKTWGPKDAEYLHATWCVKYKRP